MSGAVCAEDPCAPPHLDWASWTGHPIILPIEAARILHSLTARRKRPLLPSSLVDDHPHHSSHPVIQGHYFSLLFMHCKVQPKRRQNDFDSKFLWFI